MAIVIPERGQEAEVARKLLDLADHPDQVQSSGDGPHGVAFYVPDELAEKYEADAPEKVEEADSSEDEAPKPKRRGRPPKNATVEEE